jgi:DNA (cytosine-5)-methyltransferase 1
VPDLKFKQLRERIPVDVKEAAKLLGVSEATAYRYERGEGIPREGDLRFLKSLIESEGPRDQTKPVFRFIDLFAGIGGLRLGFESIGGQCVFTSEWDKYASKTYQANFRDDPETHQMVGDIRPFSANPEQIPEHDVLLAGFPCQPFSIAGVSKKNALGRAHGFKCVDQGNLFFDVLRVLTHCRPAAFVLENVKNLQRHDQGRTFAVIRDKLENELGYKIDFRVISARPWVPQKRERIFIVGFREDVGFSFDGFEKQIPPESEWPTLGDILQSHNEVDPKYTLTEHLWGYLQAYKEKHTMAGNGFGFGLCGPEDVARTLSARYYKDGSEILVKQPTEGRPRRLTPTECARLMGFERDGREWTVPVSDTQGYRQFGNSVVVPAVEAVARHVEPYLLHALGLRPMAMAEADRPLLAGMNG